MKSSDPAERSTVASSRADKGQAASSACPFNPRVGSARRRRQCPSGCLWGRASLKQEPCMGTSGALGSWREFWDMTYGCPEFGASRSIPCW